MLQCSIQIDLCIKIPAKIQISALLRTLSQCLKQFSNFSSNGELIQFEVMHQISRSLQRAQRIGKQSNAIVQGEPGSGKSMLLKQIEREMLQKRYIYVHWIHCKALIGT